MFSSRLAAVALLRNAHQARATYQRRAPRYQRSFSATPPARASENLEAFTAAFQKTSVFRKVVHHPDAISALQDLAGLLQNAGIDLTSGKPPSTLKMMKLATNSEFRESMKRVAEEMKKAGVDFTSKEVMDELMSLKKSGGPS